MNRKWLTSVNQKGLHLSTMTEFDIKSVIGEKLPDTRIYRKDGPESEAKYWFETVMDLYGPKLVSPGGASMYCPVSRAAVHKRLKEGKLTGYFYYPTTPRKNLFGNRGESRSQPYALIPVSELKEWAIQIEERAIEKGFVTREELEGEKPDWHGDFMLWNSKVAKEKQKRKE